MKSIAHILENPSEMESYIESLELDLDSTLEVDKQVDTIISNILAHYKDFKDVRSLKSNNIEAMTNLLRFKAELPQKRVQIKKTILDIMTKREELQIKSQLAMATTSIANNTGTLLTNLFNTLDKNEVHPIITDAEILDPDCEKIIDTTDTVDDMIKKDLHIMQETTEEKVKTKAEQQEEVLDIIKNSKDVSEIVALQQRLDEISQMPDDEEDINNEGC